jgi:hypothetical protein
VILQRRQLRARETPLVRFEMAVGECQVRRAVVVGSGQVNPLYAVGLIQEIPVIDAVEVFFRQHEDLGRLRDLPQFEKLLIVGIVDVGTSLEEPVGTMCPKPIAGNHLPVRPSH